MDIGGPLTMCRAVGVRWMPNALKSKDGPSPERHGKVLPRTHSEKLEPRLQPIRIQTHIIFA